MRRVGFEPTSPEGRRLLRTLCIPVPSPPRPFIVGSYRSRLTVALGDTYQLDVDRRTVRDLAMDVAALGIARRRRRRGGPRHLLRAAIAPGVLAVAAVAAAGVTGTFVFLSSCSLSKLRPISLGQNSFVYAGDGSLLGAVPATT